MQARLRDRSPHGVSQLTWGDEAQVSQLLRHVLASGVKNVGAAAAKGLSGVKSRAAGLMKAARGFRELRILSVGLDAAGRTTGLYQLKLGEVVTTIPTIGFNVETIEYRNAGITIWDAGGGDRIRPLVRHYYQNTQCLQYWIDSNDRMRLEDSLYWLYRFMTEIMEEAGADVRLLIMLNKQDLPNALTRDELLTRLNTPTPARRVQDAWFQQDGVIPARPAMQEWLGGAAGAPGSRWQVQPCEAINGEGLYQGLDWLLGTGDTALQEAAEAAA